MITQENKEDDRIKAFKPRQSHSEMQGKLVFDSIPGEVFLSKRAFIDASRKGIPGQWVKSIINATGFREMFVSILNVSSANLNRVYRKKSLDKEASEEVLDAVRLLNQATEVWESRELASEWLRSPVPALGGEKPINLFDTFEGRRWVSQVLNKIEHGDFS
ncbi:MbcA/ParS/Xre antitoxin family protein [Marinospirillum sp.]|uniref:MbcA/ParS/Xre antitoxin family protein n=1 Tax=Marinospirillum sp. TaxID=2183934 RepID=UPI0028702BD9|nr:MbcA/ParS/Xre antitoxin family protein [Marinospirillum sp.]MDR9468616.1 MbcA/ParS/Xre antitoxin family protein [Marinospirillum sp.]